MDQHNTPPRKKGKLVGIANNVGKISFSAVKKTKDLAIRSKDNVTDVIDVNGNGEIDIEDIIFLGLKVPGIVIKRDAFLRKELKNYIPKMSLNMQ